MPINENFSIPKEEGKVFEILPADIYQAELVDLNLESNPDYNDNTKMVNNFSFLFAILEDPNRGRWMTYRFVPTSLYIGKKGKNKLYSVVEALLARELTIEEEATMDADFISGLIGGQLRLGIKIKVDGEKKSNIIETLYPSKGSLKSFDKEETEKMLKDYVEAQKKWNEATPKKVAETMGTEEEKKEFMQQNQGDNQTQTPNLDDEIPVIEMPDDFLK